MIVDAQIHIWEADRPDRRWPAAGAEGRTAVPQRAIPLSAAEALGEMDAAGVERAIIVPPSWEGDRNDVALQAAADYPERFAVMGRIAPGPALLDKLPTWRQQPGMLGARLILSDGDPRVAEGPDHPFWHAAAAVRLPLMLAPSGKMPLLTAIARNHPALPIIVDHMGARVHRKGGEAFAQIEDVLALGNLANVAVKATCLPDYSALQHPWADVAPYVERLFQRFGAERLFWGSDLSRLPCPYPLLVETFRSGFSWLRGRDRDLVMGGGIRAWLDWR
ncbi:putative TIM-barrel fold metal-dependent hydrolase [Sphingobium wenxiniae]|uniref:L-fuconolactonase n=1 Tax=Sphingobium wenxiniae (strain DSM 21828 / CGMCC 1.7748 / JZ-1) TaxID=595605 RepID=A0A562KN54_SPHWJ|nr:MULTISPECIES: amidohydrolase family protein [Sphingobium]MBB6191912.1 putative TIM-barrel fold metal-dependent hydrolase [Sphingobium wenxiniae]TWH96663.1 L-fuconolactonase [Sphingobium wenxiniae]WRD75524.1 amidohydrolase family protein [Sphingobium baderi]